MRLILSQHGIQDDGVLNASVIHDEEWFKPMLVSGLLLASRVWPAALAAAAIAEAVLDEDGRSLALVYDVGEYDRQAWTEYLDRQEVSRGSGVYRIGSEVLKVEVGNSVRADGLRWFASAVTTPTIDPSALIRTLLQMSVRDVRESRNVGTPAQNLNVRVVLLTANNTLVEGRAAIERWAASYRGAVEASEIRPGQPSPPSPPPAPGLAPPPEELPPTSGPITSPPPFGINPFAGGPSQGFGPAPSPAPSYVPPPPSPQAAPTAQQTSYVPFPSFGSLSSVGAYSPEAEEYEYIDVPENEEEAAAMGWPYPDDAPESQDFYVRTRRPPRRAGLAPFLLPSESAAAYATTRDAGVAYFKLGGIGKLLKKGLKVAAKIAPAALSFVPGGAAVGGLLEAAVGAASASKGSRSSVKSEVPASAVVAEVTGKGVSSASTVQASIGLSPTSREAIDAAVSHAWALARAFSPREGVVHLFNAVPELGYVLVALARGGPGTRDWAVQHDACAACDAGDGSDWRGALPEGTFYKSNLINAAVKRRIGEGTYGMVHLNKFPFPVTISGDHGPVRARIALAHELAHVGNKLYKLGIPHSAVHDLGVFYATEGLPALRALEQHLGK